MEKEVLLSYTYHVSVPLFF